MSRKGERWGKKARRDSAGKKKRWENVLARIRPRRLRWKKEDLAGRKKKPVGSPRGERRLKYVLRKKKKVAIQRFAISKRKENKSARPPQDFKISGS